MKKRVSSIAAAVLFLIAAAAQAHPPSVSVPLAEREIRDAYYRGNELAIRNCQEQRDRTRCQVTEILSDDGEDLRWTATMFWRGPWIVIHES
jgi:hypothetical protein